MKTFLLLVLSAALLCAPAFSAPKTRLGDAQLKEAEKLNETAKPKAQTVDDATEDMGTGIDNTREKRESEARASQSAKEGNIESREKIMRAEQKKQDEAKDFLKKALVNREKATRTLVDNPGSKDAKEQFKKSQQSIETGAAELNKRRDNIYRLQIANDKDRYGRDWAEKSKAVPPKPYIPPGVHVSGPVKPLPKPESQAHSQKKPAEEKKPESNSKPPTDSRLTDAVNDYKDDVKKHRDEQARYDAYVEKFRKALETYRETNDPKLRERLERAKEKLLAEKKRLEEQKNDLLDRKGDLKQACSGSHSSALYASVLAVGISDTDTDKTRDITRDVVRDASREAAAQAARDAVKAAAKIAAQTASKESSKESSKTASKSSSHSASKSASQSASKPAMSHP